MVKVKINNKTYNVQELQFGDYTHMESQGISITEAFSRGQMTLIAMAFTYAVNLLYQPFTRFKFHVTG